MRRKIVKFLLIAIAILIVLGSLKYVFLVALFTIKIILIVLAAVIIGFAVGYFSNKPKKTN